MSLALWKMLKGLSSGTLFSGKASTDSLQMSPSRHETGGVLRVRLGDRLHGERHSILRKIGDGQKSTVWLTHDAEYGKPTM